MITQEQIQNDWNNIASGYDQFVTPTHMSIASEGLREAGLRRGMQFLDVASGSGALSIPAARLGAQVLSVDISPIMLERLKVRATKEGLNVETRIMNGQALELEDNIFDIAGSQFGVMLFPDMPSGLREMTRVTKPGGRILMHVLGPPEKVEFFSFFVRAIQSAVPDFTPPMDPPPLPFQLRNPERLCQEMTNVGLKEVRVETITEKLFFQSGKQLWEWLLNSNPVAEHLLVDLNLTEQQKQVVQGSLDLMVRERSVGNDVAILTNQIQRGIGKK
ncbi:class I SAM-dependent methyltransferase [bacterium]|nr:class I SAM-dependent methyltransferase [bacterium]MCI0613240.1 class I SAM-dependent methyltransferase [bacterium]